MSKILHHFKVNDLKEIVPEYFEMTVASLEDGIKRRKLKINKKNLVQLIMLEIQKINWNTNDIITTTFDLELEYVIRRSTQFEWTANKFVGNSSQGKISDLSNLIRAKIRNDQKDATVLVRKVEDLFWISIIVKNLKKIGIYEKPRYIALSSDGRYFFTKDGRSANVIQYLTSALGYEKEKKVKLTGRSLQSLLKLLLRREKVDMNNRPVYDGGKAVENECGFDFTQKKSYIDFFEKCVDDTNIDLEHYTITAVNCPWLGDDNPTLKEMEFKSAITLSGNVARIIKQLPVASIVKPPIPNYLKNFSVKGRNVLSLKYDEEKQ